MNEQGLAAANFTVLLLTFSATLLVAVLVSGTFRRSIISTAILFLLVGSVIGFGFPGLLPIEPDPILLTIVELALFGVLFTDGMRVGWQDLTRAWRLPGRALLLGMPIAFLIMTLLGRYLLDISWINSMLLAAVLSPTDPVLASAIIGREEVPYRLRHLLNVESGVNDGLALPVVIFLLSYLGLGPETEVTSIFFEVGLGLALGFIVPWLAIKIGDLDIFYPASKYEPFYAFSIGLLLLALAIMLSGNLFLAAFIAGIIVATLSTAVRDSFHHFGEFVTELLKLFSLMLFGALIRPDILLGQIPLNGFVFAFLVLFLVRPVSIAVALIGSEISRAEWIAAAWFGPKGFASMAYGLLILQSGVPEAGQLFHLIALVIIGSVLLHSSTDALVAEWFQEEEEEEEEKEQEKKLEQDLHEESSRIDQTTTEREVDLEQPKDYPDVE